jgi:hypothetical protein
MPAVLPTRTKIARAGASHQRSTGRLRRDRFRHRKGHRADDPNGDRTGVRRGDARRALRHASDRPGPGPAFMSARASPRRWPAVSLCADTRDGGGGRTLPLRRRSEPVDWASALAPRRSEAAPAGWLVAPHRRPADSWCGSLGSQPQPRREEGPSRLLLVSCRASLGSDTRRAGEET